MMELNRWGNMGQYAHPKNPGLHLNNQWMELTEIGLRHDGHKILDMKISAIKYISMKE